MAAIDAGLVAVGNVSGQDLGPATAWTSADGVLWAPSGPFPESASQVEGVAGSGTVVIAGASCRGETCIPLFRGDVAE